MDAVIRPAAWDNWGDVEREKTTRYAEYQTTGPGAASEGRAAWVKQLDAVEAETYEKSRLLSGWKP